MLDGFSVSEFAALNPAQSESAGLILNWPIDQTKAATLAAARPQLLKALRPGHWPRNLLVFGAPIAAGLHLTGATILREAAMAVALCAAASAGYLVNDLHDRQADRAHPSKRRRPIAAGDVSARAATLLAIVLAAASLVLALAVGRVDCLVVGAYLATVLAYTFVIRAIAVLDIVAVACCYLLRATAGGVATHVHLSRWFLVVTGLTALCITGGKRFTELASLQTEASRQQRAALSGHRLARLRAVWTTSGIAATVAYLTWAVRRSTGVVDEIFFVSSAMMFAVMMFCYSRSILAGRAESPEAVVHDDRTVQLFALLWFVCVTVAVAVR